MNKAMRQTLITILMLAAAAMLVACVSTGDAALESDAADDGAGSGSSSDAESSSFTLSSTAFEGGGRLPQVYTCDGDGMSPPLAWSGAPEETAEFALLMTTEARDGLKWNWVLYHIPAEVASLEENGVDIGTFGLTSDGPELAYYAPCSSGPGDKDYTFTIYALSAAPEFDVAAEEVSGAIVTEAIEPLTIESAQVTVTYARVGM